MATLETTMDVDIRSSIPKEDVYVKNYIPYRIGVNIRTIPKDIIIPTTLYTIVDIRALIQTTMSVDIRARKETTMEVVITA